MPKYKTNMRGLQVAVRIGRLLVLPITIPAWTVERIVRRWNSNFEFGYLNSAPYFTLWVLVATALLIWVDHWLIDLISLLLLTQIQLVAVATAAALALIRPGNVQQFVLQVSKRRRATAREIEVAPGTVFASLAGAAYSIWYFGCLIFYLSRNWPQLYDGLAVDSSRLGHWWSAVFLSATTFLSASGRAAPSGPASELLLLVEVATSLFFFIFLLAALVSRYLDEAVNK